MIKKVLPLILILIALIKDFFLLPTYLNVPIHFVVCLVALISELNVSTYYASIMDSKQNGLTYSIRLLSTVSCMTIVWYNTSAIVLEFSEIIQPAFDSYPNLTCSALRSENIGEMILVCTTIIQLYKTCIVYNLNFFMNMNHESTFRIVLCVFFSVCVSQNAFMLIYAETLCTKTKMQRLSSVHGIKVDDTAIKNGPPIFLYTL